MLFVFYSTITRELRCIGCQNWIEFKQIFLKFKKNNLGDTWYLVKYRVVASFPFYNVRLFSVLGGIDNNPRDEGHRTSEFAHVTWHYDIQAPVIHTNMYFVGHICSSWLTHQNLPMSHDTMIYRLLSYIHTCILWDTYVVRDSHIRICRCHMTLWYTGSCHTYIHVFRETHM